MSDQDITITDLTIPGKRGPFKIRMLEYDEAIELFTTKANDKTPMMLRMAQMCLVNGAGKPVYAANQMAKMKKEIRPAATLMAIGLKAYRLNKIGELVELNERVEEAEKN